MLAPLQEPTDSIECLRNDASHGRTQGSGLDDTLRSRAVALQARGVPAKEVAAAVGVHETTLYGWVRSGKYSSPFRSLVVEASRVSLGTNSIADLAPRLSRKSGSLPKLDRIRIRYPRGTRVSLPLAGVSAEILAALLSFERGE